VLTLRSDWTEQNDRLEQIAANGSGKANVEPVWGIHCGSNGEELLSRQRIWLTYIAASAGISCRRGTVHGGRVGYKSSQDIIKEKGGGS